MAGPPSVPKMCVPTAQNLARVHRWLWPYSSPPLSVLPRATSAPHLLQAIGSPSEATQERVYNSASIHYNPLPQDPLPDTA